MAIQLLKPRAAEMPSPGQLPPSLGILLVEDHSDTAMMMCRMLRKRGGKVDHAPDMATAQTLLAEKEFDLLLSDLGLPDGTGWDIMRALRSQGSKLPGIALSGYGQDLDIQTSMDAGYSAHFTKPFNVDVLMAKVWEIVRK